MGYMILSQKIHNFGVLILESECQSEKCVLERRSKLKNTCRVFFRRKASEKTHLGS